MAGTSLKWNVGCAWAAHASALAIGFFLMPYVIGVLGDSQYGMWVLINSAAAYGGLLYMGMGETICRYVAKYHSENERERLNEVVTLVASVYGIGALLALLVSGTIAIAAGYLGHFPPEKLVQVRCVILILGVNLAIGLMGSVFGGVLMGLRRFDLERTVGVVFDVVRIVLIVVFLQREWGLVTIALIYLCVTLLENISFLILAFREIPWLRIAPRHWKREVFRECSSFSVMALLNNLASHLISATDSIVIGIMFGATAIVPYYIAQRLTLFIRQPIDKLAVICMPTAGALQAVTDRSRLHRLFLKTFGFTFLATTGLSIGAFYFGGDLINLWVGSQYAEAHRLLCILLGVTLVSVPCNVLRSFLLAQGQVRFPAIVYISEAVANLLLSICLGLWMGREGVAWGTLIPAVVFELGWLLPVGLGMLGIPLLRLLSQSIRPQLAPLGALAAYCWVVTPYSQAHGTWLALLCVTAGGGAVLGAVWWLTNRLPNLTRTTDLVSNPNCPTAV